MKKIIKITIINYINQKRQQNYKKKTKWIEKKRTLIRKQNESNKEIKQNERKQKRETVLEDIDLGRFFELATTNRKYVNGLNLHEIKN